MHQGVHSERYAPPSSSTSWTRTGMYGELDSGEVSDFIGSSLRGETYRHLEDVDTAAEAMSAS